MDFAEWLKQQRRVLDLTQQQLADQVGCSVVTIRKFESGERRPSKELASLLAEVLQVPQEERAAFISFARLEPGAGEPGLHEPAQDGPWRELRSPVPRHFEDSTTARYDAVKAVQDESKPGAAGGQVAAATTQQERRGHGLPAQATPFVGRATELRELAQRLAEPACRLLTLVGPGGIGKTRLALALAAAEAQRFAQGAVFVPLVGLTSPGDLPMAIANATGLSFGGQADARAQLLRLLRPRAMLLVLDNIEQLLPAGADPNPALQLIAELLAQAPRLKLLVTSRERLLLAGEWVYAVRGMHYPQPDDELASGPDEAWLQPYSALQLFVACARRVRADFVLEPGNLGAVLRICRAVEGMPLGIELASSWLYALEPDEIAAEIEQGLDLLSSAQRDVPERHRSLRNVFDSSWRRLTPDEQEVLKRLSVFHGGFDRQAAQALAGASLEQLAALISRSLLQHAGSRYEMHELLRQYCLAQLKATAPGEEAQVRSRHSRHFCQLLAAERGRLSGRQEAQALARIEAEIDNIRAAWRWAVEQRQAELVQQAGWSLARFYEIRGWYEEGVQAFSSAAEALRGAAAPAEQLILAGINVHLALMFSYSGTPAQARPLLEASLAVGQQLEDAGLLAQALSGCGNDAMFTGRPQEASACFQQALQLYEALGDQYGIAQSLDGLAWAASDLRDLQLAEHYHRRSLAVARQHGPLSTMAWTLMDMATNARMQGAYQAAQAYAQEALVVCETLDYPFGRLSALIELGEAARALGLYSEAQRCYQAGLTLRGRIGDVQGTAWCLAVLTELALTLGQAGEAMDLLQELQAFEQGYGVDVVPQGYYHYARSQLELSRGNALAAEDHARQSRELLLTSRRRTYALLPALLQGWALYTLGQDRPAWQIWRDTLEEARRSAWLGVALEAACGLALLLARQGAHERAAGLLSALQRHPASTQETRQRAARALAQLAPQLPQGRLSAVTQAAQVAAIEQLLQDLL